MQAGEFVKKLLPVFFVCAVVLVFSTIFQKDFYAPKFFFFQLGVLTCFSVFLWGLFVKKKSELAESFIPILTLLFLLWLAISSVFFSVPFLSQQKFFWYLTWGCFLLIVWLLNLDLATLEFSFLIFEFLAVPILLYGFIQHFGLDPIHWSPGGYRIFSTLGNADQFGTFLGVLICISMVKFLEKPKLLRFILIEMELIVLFWSYTRAPFISLFLIFVVLLAVAAGVPSLKLVFPRLFFLAACFGATLAILFYVNSSPAAGGRFLPAALSKSPGVVGRLFLLKKGIEVLALHPFIGVGPGNFSYAYLPLTRKQPSFYRNRMAVAESTHNEFLDVLDEAGFPGGLFFLSLWVVSMIQALSGIETCEKKEAFIRLAVFAVLLSSFISLQFLYFGVSLGAFISYFMGASTSFSRRKFSLMLTPRESGVILAILSAGIVLWGGYSVRILIGDFYHHSGAVRMKEQNWKRAGEDYSTAIFWDPWNPFLYDRLGKVFEASDQSNLALKNYSKALLGFDINPYFWADLGRLSAKKNWKNLALAAYEQAVDLDPYNSFFCHDAALTALKFKLYRLAYFYARQAHKLNPDNASDVYYMMISLLRMNRRKSALHYQRIYQFLQKKQLMQRN